MTKPGDVIAQEIWQAYVVEVGRSLPEGLAEKMAHAVVEALGLTEEVNAYEATEVTAQMGGEGAMRYGGQTIRSLGWRTQRRWVTDWS
jgi:hypothetical protein